MAKVSGTKRKRWRSEEERRQLVEESLGPGVAVADVARAHGIRPSQLFHWRKLYRAGRLGGSTGAGARLLPVTVGELPVHPPALGRDDLSPAGTMSLELPHARLHLAGSVDVVSLRLLLEWLRR